MKKWFLLNVIFIMFSHSLFSQFSERVYYLKSNIIDFGSNYQSFKIGETTLSEISFPVLLTIPISDKMSFSINNSPVMIKRKSIDSVLKINRDLTGKAIDTVYIPKENNKDLIAMTDVRVGFRYLLLNNNGLLNLSINLPTGKKELEDTLFNIETQLGLNILKYRIPLFGQGFNAGGSFVYAYQLNKKNILGFGVFGNYKTKYKPVQSVEYSPGSDLGGSISYIFQPSFDTRLNLDLSYRHFTKDKISFVSVSGQTEKNVDLDFQAGGKISMVAQFFMKTGSLQHLLLVQERIMGKNKQQTAEINSVTRTIIYNDKEVTNGQQFEASYNLGFPLSASLSMNAIVFSRIYSAGQENWDGIVVETGNSSVFGGGLGAKFNIFDNLNLDISAKYLSGKIKILKEENVSGLDAYAKFNLLF